MDVSRSSTLLCSKTGAGLVWMGGKISSVEIENIGDCINYCSCDIKINGDEICVWI